MEYLEQKEKHEKELNEFTGMFFAFSEEQLEKGMLKVNASTESELASIGAGCYILKSKVQSFKDMLDRHDAEKKQIKENQRNLLEAFVYELKNHEYCITWDINDALEVLGLKVEEVPPEILEEAKLLANQTD